MRLLTIFCLFICNVSSSQWTNNFDSAKQKARSEHKNILLNFSGSDWCGPCIRMHKEIFDDASFKSFADTSLVLIYADFPRLKKNQLDKTVQAQNNKLADQYNSKGIFPYTILLSAEGKVLKAWEGLPKETPEAFAGEINTTTHGSN